MTVVGEYISPNESHKFQIDDAKIKDQSIQGRTTKSSIVIPGYIDKDKPNEIKNNYMGKLRLKLTILQDDINEFLTEKMI